MAVTNAALQRAIAEETEWWATIAQRAMDTAEPTGYSDITRNMLRDQGFDVPERHTYRMRITRQIPTTQVLDIVVNAPDEEAAQAAGIEAARNGTARNRYGDRAYWEVFQYGDAGTDYEVSNVRAMS